MESVADLAWVELLADDPQQALDTLVLAVRGAHPVPVSLSCVLAACVLIDPSLWRQATRLGLEAGMLGGRLVYRELTI
jgi:hypothetical protein